MSTDLPFTPVRLRARRDGWTPARQVAFVAALRTLGNVAAACRAVGMSWQTAYRLRARADTTGFAAAWDAALAPDLSHPVIGRAVGGSVTPIFYRGKRIGERRRYDNRLAMFLLQRRCPERYGPGATYSGGVGPVRTTPAAEANQMRPRAQRAFFGDVSRTSSPSTPVRGVDGSATAIRRAPASHWRSRSPP